MGKLRYAVGLRSETRVRTFVRRKAVLGRGAVCVMLSLSLCCLLRKAYLGFLACPSSSITSH